MTNTEIKSEIPDEIELSKHILFTKMGLEVLALISAQQLSKLGYVTLYLNSEGKAMVAAPGEVELDGLPEDEAIQKLLDLGYNDANLQVYLEGRDMRSRYLAAFRKGEPSGD